MNRLLATLISFMLVVSVFAQTTIPIKGGEAMQTQLINAYLKAKQMGMSDNEIKAQLVKKGYPATTINEIKKMAQNKQAYGMGANISASDTTDNSVSQAGGVRDSSWIFKTPLSKEVSPYFGYSFFSEAFLDYAPNTNMATPENYVLGPGDELLVTVTGLNAKEITGYITAEGYYTLPYVGMLQLNAVTIEVAKKMISQKLAKIYPGLNTGATKLNVRLGQLRTIQVMITGEASRPGS